MGKQLTNGNIPPHTRCRFAETCEVTNCPHRGILHETEFTCATARALEMVETYEAENRKDGGK